MHTGKERDMRRGNSQVFLQLFPLIFSIWILASSLCHGDLGFFLSRQGVFVGKKKNFGADGKEERTGEEERQLL